MHHASLEPDPPFRSIQSHTFQKVFLEDTIIRIPLVDSLVCDHLVLGQDIPIVAQEVLGFLEYGYWQYDINQEICAKENEKPYNSL